MLALNPWGFQDVSAVSGRVFTDSTKLTSRKSLNRFSAFWLRSSVGRVCLQGLFSTFSWGTQPTPSLKRWELFPTLACLSS